MSLTLYQAGFFELLKCRGDFLDRVRKAVIKAAYFTKPLETWYNTSLDFNKTFNISDVIKMITSALFRMP